MLDSLRIPPSAPQSTTHGDAHYTGRGRKRGIRRNSVGHLPFTRLSDLKRNFFRNKGQGKILSKAERIPITWIIGSKGQIYQGASELRCSKKRRYICNVELHKSWPFPAPPRQPPISRTRAHQRARPPVGRGTGSAEPAEGRCRHYRLRGYEE